MIPTRQSPKPMSSMNSMNSLPPYLQTFSPSGHSPHHRSSSSSASELDKYLSELLTERQKLGPFMQVLPNCSRLLNQEIMRLTSLVGTTSYGEHDSLEHGSLLASGGLMSNGMGLDSSSWSSFQSERLVQQASAMSWRGLPGSPGPVIKKLIRIEVPVDKYPTFNFVGRLLGPRGNSLKRVESNTGCRVFIRGRGSVRDTDKGLQILNYKAATKCIMYTPLMSNGFSSSTFVMISKYEEKLRDKPGYEHLNEPLHVLIEAEQPAHVIDIQLNQAREIIEDLLKPVEETHDYFKKQQLRELAMLNGTLREDSPSWSGNASPFSNSGMKRAKTRG